MQHLLRSHLSPNPVWLFWINRYASNRFPSRRMPPLFLESDFPFPFLQVAFVTGGSLPSSRIPALYRRLSGIPHGIFFTQFEIPDFDTENSSDRLFKCGLSRAAAAPFSSSFLRCNLPFVSPCDFLFYHFGQFCYSFTLPWQPCRCGEAYKGGSACAGYPAGPELK